MKTNKTHGSAVLIAILLFLFLVGAFSYMEYSRHQSLLIQEKTSETERLLYYLEDYIEDMKDHLLLIANLWNMKPSGEQEEMILEIAEEMITLFPANRFIHFIDTDLVIRHSAPQEKALHLIGRDVSQYEENIPLYEKMIETEKPVFSPIMWRPTSEIYSAHLWVPILEGPELLGIISTDLDLSSIISKMIRETDLSYHSIIINASDIDIFRTDERQTYPVEITHEIMNIPWTIGVYIDDRMSPSIVFLFGVLLSLLVSFSLYKMLMKNRLLENSRLTIKESEEKYKKSEERFQRMLSLVPDMISIHDPAMNIKYSNWNGFGNVPQEKRILNSKCYSTYRDLEDICPDCQAITVLQTKEVFQKEIELPEGIWIDLRVIPLLDQDGSVEFFIEWVRDITQRKQMEQELQESNEKLSGILNNMKDVVWSISWPDLTPIYLSPSVEKLYGRDLQDFIDNPSLFKEVTHPDDQYRTDITMKQLLEEGEATRECRIIKPDGSIVWIYDKSRMIYDKNNQPIRVEGLAQDITDRKEKENEIRKQKERLASILEGTNVGTWEWNVQTGETNHNQRWAEIMGYTLEELSPISIETWKEYTHPEDLKASNQILEKHFAGEIDYYDIECRMKHKEGHWVWIQDRGKVISWTEDGKPLWVYGTHQDITERKEAEESLYQQQQEIQEAHQRLLTVLDSLSIGINVIAMDSYEILYMSKHARHLHGDVIGERCWQVFHKDQTGPCDFCTTPKLLDATGRPVGVFKSESYNEKLERWYERHDIAIEWIDGRIVRLEMTLDITERKQMEGKIQHQHEFQKVVANISYRFINTPNSQMNEAIHHALYQIGTFFNVDRAYLFQFSSDGKSKSNTHEWCREGIESQIDLIQNQPVDDFPWIKNAIQTKEYVFIPDVNAINYEEERKEWQRQGIQSLICIPIKVKERVVGFIGMDSVTKKMVWDNEEITLLKVISEIMSSAFSKHQMEHELIHRTQEVEQLNQHLNQEIEKAHHIHSNILPKEFPSIQGISFAAFYQPAEKLGGDFYEVIQVNNKLVMYLSDISGHGLDGSMINFFVKEAIHSYISLKPDEISPERILKHLEQQFRQEDYPDELFICIFLAVLDLETMELTYTGAGFQDTPFVRQGDGEEAMLRTKRLFINSIFPIHKSSFQEKRITLTPGSTIFFNTDGLTEQGEPGAFYKDRLSQIFYENAHLPPDLISQAVVEDFRLFNNNSLQGDDDITFLILKVDTENTKHQFELGTDFEKLEGLRNKAMEILPNVVESEVLINALYELVANAMEHGNQMDSTKKVMVELIVYDDYIQARVEDEGAGFNWRDKIDKPFELEGHKKRGRGIAMTRILCDSLFYNDQGNKVTSVVQFSQGGGVCK